ALAAPSRSEANRSKQAAALVQGVVPVTVVVKAPARRPDIVRGAPDPVRPVGHPVTGPPEIARLVITPATGDVAAIRFRGESRGPSRQRFRRRRQVLNFL